MTEEFLKWWFSYTTGEMLGFSEEEKQKAWFVWQSSRGLSTDLPSA